ncbi:hypothetical protein Aperf_G00000112099 [Anoplocephala perfoliata]
MHQNSNPGKYQTWKQNCSTTAVLVASPKTTNLEDNIKFRHSSRHNIAAPSADIQMSTLPTSRQRRKQVTFTSHSSSRRSRRSGDTALCRHHPLPERYLRVREVEIDEEPEGDGRNSSISSNTDDDINSEIDAYSRFLFPCCFILCNCAYWGFYLIIADPGFMTS